MAQKENYNQKYADMTGTYYNIQTPTIVCDILEESRISLHRLRIYYGNKDTGRAWGDVLVGHVGRSTGTFKVPLLISNKNSTGGCQLLDACIVKIEHANKKDGGTIYQHATYLPFGARFHKQGTVIPLKYCTCTICNG